MPLSVMFLEELHQASRKDWPGIVRKHGLTPDEIKRAAEILRKEKESMSSWGAWRK